MDRVSLQAAPSACVFLHAVCQFSKSNNWEGIFTSPPGGFVKYITAEIRTLLDDEPADQLACLTAACSESPVCAISVRGLARRCAFGDV